ncbi:transmembrane emp24 domain-containing protein [Anaeramoeba flamelloides]|uniref:Transmembrane emp24 domain-containing protein n=1 Tax=Anaeramoeba flamelloides TaxID=1746091 RepID=A0AAV7YXK7_9EUKA|nr:transmembrane emp24 domain-containing protein [Anaeramoeba flamelloides]KAJ6254321.1 transmembrane emp24 domain-containing protein [Anaeramoeba flamelloides]
MKLLQKVIFVLLLLKTVFGITFTVEPNKKECLFEEIKKQTPVTILYQVVSGGGMDINLNIISPTGKPLYTGEKENEGKFTFVSEDEGEYQFCFGNEMSTLTSKEVNLNIRLGTRSQKSDIAKKRHLTQLETGVIELQEGLQKILSEQHYLMIRERRHRNTTESTNARVLWWSFLEAFLLMAMAIAQIYYLKRMFKVQRAI